MVLCDTTARPPRPPPRPTHNPHIKELVRPRGCLIAIICGGKHRIGSLHGVFCSVQYMGCESWFGSFKVMLCWLCNDVMRGCLQSHCWGADKSIVRDRVVKYPHLQSVKGGRLVNILDKIPNPDAWHATRGSGLCYRGSVLWLNLTFSCCVFSLWWTLTIDGVVTLLEFLC